MYLRKLSIDSRMLKPETNQLVNDLSGSTKSSVVAYVLWVFLGLFGGHRFYLGTPVTGLALMLCTLSFIGIPVSLVWWVVDAFLIPRLLKGEGHWASPLLPGRVMVITPRFTS